MAIKLMIRNKTKQVEISGPKGFNEVQFEAPPEMPNQYESRYNPLEEKEDDMFAEPQTNLNIDDVWDITGDKNEVQSDLDFLEKKSTAKKEDEFMKPEEIKLSPLKPEEHK